MEPLDPVVCYRAFQAHDRRFDGRVFVGVLSTGIYCRPICPARPPKFENCRYFASAAAAHEAGFRPCLRCRPETAPGAGAWRGTSAIVSRGVALIAEGALDGDGASVERLADRLGVGERQLRRLFLRHVGASPIAMAQARRVLLAKQLIHESRLPMGEIALAAGFGSVRRFNETFRELFKRPPRQLRRTARSDEPMAGHGVTVKLRYRPPYDWPAMLAALAARSTPGLDSVDGDVYRRRLGEAEGGGSVEVTHDPQADCIAAAIRVRDVRALTAIVARVRRLFDLDADIGAIGAHLSRDPQMARLVAQRPGLRAPGGWEADEDWSAPPSDRRAMKWRPWQAYAQLHLQAAAHA